MGFDLTKVPDRVMRTREKVGPSDNGSVKEEALISGAMRENMKLLELAQCDDIHEYAKVLIWGGNKLKELWQKKLEQDKKDGWEIVERTWCGIPYDEFKLFHYA